MNLQESKKYKNAADLKQNPVELMEIYKEFGEPFFKEDALQFCITRKKLVI